VTSFATDGRHVRAIAADRFATLPAGDARFIWGKFVSGPLGVRCSTTLAGDLTLFGRIHRRKTALARICHFVILLRAAIWYCWTTESASRNVPVQAAKETLRKESGGERGIRTLGRALRPYGGLANRWFQPLTHLSGMLARGKNAVVAHSIRGEEKNEHRTSASDSIRGEFVEDPDGYVLMMITHT